MCRQIHGRTRKSGHHLSVDHPEPLVHGFLTRMRMMMVRVACATAVSTQFTARLSRCGQGMAAPGSADTRSCPSCAVLALLLLHRLGGVTTARYLLLAGNTRWKRLRSMRGFGTRAARRASYMLYLSKDANWLLRRHSDKQFEAYSWVEDRRPESRPGATICSTFLTF